jgi:adenine-specific DNA-methyltransferase
MKRSCIVVTGGAGMMGSACVDYLIENYPEHVIVNIDDLSGSYIENINKKCKFIKLEKWGSSAYREDRPSLYYSIKDPSDKDYYPKAPDGREGRWRSKPEKLKSNNITWIERRNNLIPYEVIYFEDVQDKMRIIKERSILYDIASTTDAAKDIIALFGKKIFDTPKPERLIHRILTLATNEGDLVLDSFLGSGTTVAVAHKMGRRYIGIEMGEHAKTHCAARLQKVIDGEQGGISKDVNCQGGGGFRFYNLGEAIFDEEGKINKKIRFEHLAAHIWFSETKTPLTQKDKSPLLGVHNDIAYYLLYNGILGDKTIDGGNVLNSKTLDALPNFNGTKVIYAEATSLGSLRIQEEQIIFKQTPYDIKAR